MSIMSKMLSYVAVFSVLCVFGVLGWTLIAQGPPVIVQGTAQRIEGGTVLPSQCSPGPPTMDVFSLKSGGTAHQYNCTAPNTWTLVGAAGPSGPSGPAGPSGPQGPSNWNGLTNPSGALSLTMGANGSTFTFNAATGSIDGFKLTDTASNTGTGILSHPTTASGSSMTPWQADQNGKGYQVTALGGFAGVGQTTSTDVQFQGATSGSCDLTTQAVSVGIIPGSAGQCHFGSATVPFNGIFHDYLQGASAAPSVTNASCTGAAIGTGATNTAGTITGLPTGTCTVVLTFVSATATTGWSCGISDRTTGNLFRQTATTQTSVTFTGTSVSGDTLQYGPCAAY